MNIWISEQVAEIISSIVDGKIENKTYLDKNYNVIEISNFEDSSDINKAVYIIDLKYALDLNKSYQDMYRHSNIIFNNDFFDPASHWRKRDDTRMGIYYNIMFYSLGYKVFLSYYKNTETKLTASISTP